MSTAGNHRHATVLQELHKAARREEAEMRPVKEPGIGVVPAAPQKFPNHSVVADVGALTMSLPPSARRVVARANASSDARCAQENPRRRRRQRGAVSFSELDGKRSQITRVRRAAATFAAGPCGSTPQTSSNPRAKGAHPSRPPRNRRRALCREPPETGESLRASRPSKAVVSCHACLTVRMVNSGLQVSLPQVGTQCARNSFHQIPAWAPAGDGMRQRPC